MVVQWNGGYGDDDWRRSRWGDRPEGRARPTAVDELVDLALHGGLWVACCLAIASFAPAVLVPALLRELLLMAGFAVSVAGLWRGESLTLGRFNRQDVALALLALGVITGLFIDHAAVEAFVQAQGAATAA